MAAGYHPEPSAFAARCALFPLPEGEGQGEGKRRERPARVSDHSRNCRTGRVLRRSRRFPKMTMSRTVPYLRTAAWLILALLFLYPMLWMTLSSFKSSNAEIFGQPFSLPHQISFANYQ